MKKLAIFLIVLVSLVVIAGCNTSKKTVTRFTTDTEKEDTNGSTTTVTKVGDDTKAEPAKIEIPAVDSEDNEVTVSDNTAGNGVVFAVTSPTEKVVDTDKGYHLILGTTPKNTDKILVNGNAVTKYKAGSTQWNYIAAASLGTLKQGRNYYTVKALDDKGNELGSASFTINYKGLVNTTLAGTGTNSLFIAIIASVLGYLALSYSGLLSLVKVKK